MIYTVTSLLVKWGLLVIPYIVFVNIVTVTYAEAHMVPGESRLPGGNV